MLKLPVALWRPFLLEQLSIKQINSLRVSTASGDGCFRGVHVSKLSFYREQWPGSLAAARGW